jgi:hypothetical protein
VVTHARKDPEADALAQEQSYVDEILVCLALVDLVVGLLGCSARDCA